MLYNVRMNSLLGENSYGARAGAIYSADVCFYIVISLIISLIIQGAGLTGDAAAYLGYFASPIAICITLALSSKYLKTPLRAAAPIKCAPKYYLIAILAVFGLLFAISPLNSLFVQLLQLCGYMPAQSALPSPEGWGMMGCLVVIALLPAAVEELLFRGSILYNTNLGAGTVKSIFLTALLFSLYHGSVEQTIYQFICGCVFALIALRSDSVLPSMLAHFLNNGIIIVLNGQSVVDESGNLPMTTWGYALLIVCAALSLAGALAWLIIDKKPVRRGLDGETKSLFVWGGAGLLVMFLVWILGLFSL